MSLLSKNDFSYHEYIAKMINAARTVIRKINEFDLGDLGCMIVEILLNCPKTGHLGPI